MRRRKRTTVGIVASGTTVLIVVGILWTIVAGTIWQWVPIIGSIAVVFKVAEVVNKSS